MCTLPPTSPPINEEKLAEVLENVCQKGCDRVEVIIDALQKGSTPEIVNQLNEDEIAKLLSELIEVMIPLKHKE